MPERVYIDLGGGEQVPAETWAGATVENVTEALIESSGHPHPETLGLRALLGSVVVPEISDKARALLEELVPEAIPHLEDQLEQQRRRLNR
jgi:hypothetical protein